MKPGAEVTIKALSKGFEVLWSDDEDQVSVAVAGCTTMECAFAFIRSKMEPVAGREKPQWTEATLEAMRAVNELPTPINKIEPIAKASVEIVNIVGETTVKVEDAREPRRFMDDKLPEYTRKAVDPISFGAPADIIELQRELNKAASKAVRDPEPEVGRLGQEPGYMPPEDRARLYRGAVNPFTGERVKPVALPPAPRHGDFGSMGEGA